MKNRLALLLSCIFFFTWTLHAQVVINEYSASNMNTFIDNFNKYEDWVELYNTSTQAADISGWFLSDKQDNPEKWEIPAGTVIPPNGYALFWTSGRDTAMVDGVHTNFKLTQTKGNDYLVFSNPNGDIQEVFPLNITLLAHSQARETDGSLNWMVCTQPTPGGSNDGTDKYTGYAPAPTMNLEGGYFNGEQKIVIYSPDPNLIIRYTTDGGLPRMDDPIYTDTITVSQTTVVKARAFSPDSLTIPSKVAFNTYFIDENFTLAVFSVAADSVIDLANGQGEIRPIGSVEYFNQNKERTASAYGELNRHGQDSWALPHRSLDFVTRDEMGYTHTVAEKLFSYSDRDEYQRLMFRASGDDNYPAVDDWAHQGSTHLRDEYVHTLAMEGDMNLDVRAVERVIVFLNGQYWGVYGLRERPVDHDYTNYYYDQGKYDLYYLNTWGSTWAEYGGQAAFDEWGQLRDFIMEKTWPIRLIIKLSKITSA